MILTCLKCGQAWHVSAKTKRKANNYICPKCEMHNKKSTDGTATRAGSIASSIPNSAKNKKTKISISEKWKNVKTEVIKL